MEEQYLILLISMIIIKRSPIPIYTYVEGVVASAATIISIAGKKRFMTPNSMLMIHQQNIWLGNRGNSEEIIGWK